MVQASGIRTVLLDADMTTIQRMRSLGFRAYFGDPRRPELLHAAGLAKARVFVVAVDDRATAVQLVRYARAERPDLAITARAHDRMHVYELYAAGADHIVREMFDSSLRAARYVLEDMGLTEYEAHELETAFYRHDRYNLRELAELWQPGVPVEQNARLYGARPRVERQSCRRDGARRTEEPPEAPETGRRKRGDAGALARRPGGSRA